MSTNIYEIDKESVRKKTLLTQFITHFSNVSDPLHYKQVYIFGRYIKEEKLVLILSIIFSSIIGIFGIIFELYSNYISLSILILVIYMIGGLPYLFYKYIEDKINENILDNYPYFLSYLSESLASGMTLLDALNYVASIDLGYLNIFIRKLHSWIKWGMPFEKAFSLFNKYFEDLPSIKMINYVILETYIGGGDISKSLKRLYEDLESIRELEKLKRSYVSQQIIVLYAIYIIFIGLSIAILSTLQPLINSQLIAASLNSSFNFFSYSINYGWLKFITAISILLVGVSSAIVMGIAESSKIRSSVKHLAINSFIGLLSIIIFILPVSVNLTLNIYPQTAYVYSPVNIQIYASADAQPLSNIPITITIVGNNFSRQFYENLQNGYYSMSITFNNTGEYTIIAVMNYEGKVYTQKQKINIPI
jgi:archaellum biogenesis protein FlaJ (TadC family)